MTFKSIFDFMAFFKDEDTCRQFLKNRRFPDGVRCIYCNHDKIYEYKGRDLFKCSECKKRFSIRKGTIFDDSRVSLQKWYMAIYLINTSSKGISSVQLADKLGVTQKTSWFMAHRIRFAYDKKGDLMLGGDVEIDETYVGEKERNKHNNKKTKGTQGRNTLTKQAVIGGLQRDVYGNRKIVNAQCVNNTKLSSVRKFVYENVYDDSNVITDEYRAYKKLGDNYSHYSINHSKKQYVSGVIHTNGIENFWSILKRGYVGVYHYMSKKHLQRYVNEYVYRYNNKRSFDCIFSDINVKVTYKELIKGY